MPNTRTSGSLAVVLLALASTAASQVSGTIEDQLDGEIVDAAVAQAEAGVEEGVLDTLDDQVAEDVEAAVDESLDDAVDQQADDAVTAGVEETLEDTVETTVEDSLDETVEQQADDAVTAGVEETLDETVESVVETSLDETVEQQTGDALASSVEETLEGTVESTLEGNLDSVVEGAVESGIAGVVEDAIDGAAKEAVGGVSDPFEPLDWRDQSLIPGVLSTSDHEQLVSRFNAAADARLAGDTSRAVFYADLDGDGWMIERGVFAALVDPGDVDAVRAAGVRIRSRRPLPGLGKVLVRFDAPLHASLRGLTERLRQDLPDARVDYNHLYFPAAGDTLDDTVRDGASRRANGERASRSVGMIDSALDPAHPAIADRAIEQRDFVTVDAARPVGHGTAVASILCAGLPDDTGVLAASVFFSYEGMAPGASTESLVAALDWMLERGMDTVNMSLSGPPNALLQEAIEDASGRGVTIVAAVGNNGPAGRPLFPAAYPEVVGVTAVDRDNRVFLYANRGKHVVFASPGVDVRVADVGGGYRTASGTSMASPRVAARIAAEATRSRGSRPAVERLKGTATDLGEAGFDPVFGYGLVDAAAQ